jgi:hypothetical protein
MFSHVKVDNFIYNKTKYCDGTLGFRLLWGPQKGGSHNMSFVALIYFREVLLLIKLHIFFSLRY